MHLDLRIPRLAATRGAAFLCLALAALSAVHALEQKPLELAPPKPAVATKPASLEKPEESKCAACHADVVKEWATTAHAIAWVDQDYQESLTDKKKPETCHGCHTPVTLAGADLKSKPAARADDRRFGVSCETCHVDTAGVVHGPRGTKTDAHATTLDPRLVASGSSELCSTCHKFNIGPVVGIAKDFESAKLAERGLSCVGCHFQLVETKFATSTKDDVPARKGRRHALQTPRDPDFLKLAFGLTARGEGGKTILRVQNQAGHRVPGLIGRSMEFQAEVLDAAGKKIGEGKLALDTGNYLPVDDHLELTLNATGARVHVVGKHTDPRALAPIPFLDATIDIGTR